MRRYQHLQIAWMPVGVLGVATVSAAAMAARASENLLFVGSFTVTVTDDAIMLRSGLWINFKDPGQTRDLYATLIATRVLSR